METKELEVDNYHNQSKKIEEAFFVALLLLFTPLLLALKETKPLDHANIESEVINWWASNASAIQELTTNQVLKIKKLVDKIFGKPIISNDQVKKYSSSDVSLIRNIIDTIKTKFFEFATIDKTYPMAPEVKNDYIAGIVNSIEDKTELFATMSTISTIRSMMFEGAREEGFTEYQWHTQRDNRVRPTHAAMDKKWVKLDQPPAEAGYYHVGQDWNCRCFADKFR